ncbi:MAG: GNAT family N-acetyltransferase [Jatrophihabitans sp.]|uniref:GNAT family N-acetyltransferase n=1 Tax=Jatrophihabitans sp. TaxID=1932789 RepID=UPI003F7D6C96
MEPAPPDDWYELPVLAGQWIRLEPLTQAHADGYLAAAGTGAEAEEVFRWLNTPGSTTGAPRTRADAEADIAAALAARERRERLAFVQLDAATGEVAGTTSYYDVVPASRTLAIGSTWLGCRWWRTPANTESKLLLLTRAFEVLGAVRVVWHTDEFNRRSRDAIARLGATPEGLLRKHRLRRDGSWRTTAQFSMTDDDWPAARERLRRRLEP